MQPCRCLRLLQRPRCRRRLPRRRRTCVEAQLAEEGEEAGDAGSLVDRLCFSRGSGRGSRAWRVVEVVEVPERGVVVVGGVQRTVRLKDKRGDSSPHGPER